MGVALALWQYDAKFDIQFVNIDMFYYCYRRTLSVFSFLSLVYETTYLKKLKTNVESYNVNVVYKNLYIIFYGVVWIIIFYICYFSCSIYKFLESLARWYIISISRVFFYLADKIRKLAKEIMLFRAILWKLNHHRWIPMSIIIIFFIYNKNNFYRN